MSLASRILQQGSRLWSGLSAARGFHILTRPAAPTTGTVQNAQMMVAASGISQGSGLLSPASTLVQQVAGFKVKGRLKRRCKDCYIVVRQERGYVICPTHPRHKQMSMKKRDYKSWILTHATQSKERGY
ncbi:39S ribosomal protein L36, mitochondrial [Drosophila biarmipes]|uniref:39S ribosomal protein L36, mitochondrial n=1 Tax=Drosophila biarmipes TaxID=125945 RepID=UPI0007E5CA35|nr:39S ribosomal protein L36, mitochondrial [Drosophila biarmipes]XP_016966367.1 39S ribosomal protein L36, mitochondrial [Drosophila biarmipes]